MKIMVTPLTKRYVLVDYDNVVKAIGASARLSTITAHIIKRLDESSDFFDDAKMLENIIIRLYGGWFEGKTYARCAQDIRADIGRGDMPTYTLKKEVKVYPTVSLATSMLSCEGQFLYNTKRKRDLSKVIDFTKTSCCEASERHYNFVRMAVSRKECPYCKKNWFYQAFVTDGQKMVDAMLFCDFLHISDGKNRVALVSSDSDMIPVMIQVSRMGNRAYHLLTGSEGEMCDYTKLFGTTYSKINW